MEAGSGRAASGARWGTTLRAYAEPALPKSGYRMF